MKKPIVTVCTALLGLFWIFLLLLTGCGKAPEPPAIPSSALPAIQSSSVPANTVTAAPSDSLPASSTPASSSPPASSSVPVTSSVPASSSIPASSSAEATAAPDSGERVFLNSDERAALDEMIASYPGEISVYYLMPETGEIYTYEPEKLYYAASLVKAPYALYLLQLADRGECDLDLKMTLRDSLKQAGTGKLKDEPEGNVYTVRELIEYMITVSDNTAFKMLRNKYSLRYYDRFCREELGVNHTTYQDINAEDMAKCMAAIYRYIESDSENARFLRDLMGRAVFPLIKAPDAQQVIHKHGWAYPSLNDMAIVYEENPYILVILSDRCDGTKEDIRMFREISEAIKAYHDLWEDAPAPEEDPPESSSPTVSESGVSES